MEDEVDGIQFNFWAFVQGQIRHSAVGSLFTYYVDKKLVLIQKIDYDKFRLFNQR